MTTVGEPRISYLIEQSYMGIRKRVPMKSMSKVVTKLFKDMNAWKRQQNLKLVAPPFLRYYVINMAGEMDIEVGMPVAIILPDVVLSDDEQICANVLPAGHYASLIYTRSGIAGNKALVEWAKANIFAWDRWDDPKGYAFRSRYESYLTDPEIKPRRTKWEIEVAIKLADDPT